MSPKGRTFLWFLINLAEISLASDLQQGFKLVKLQDGYDYFDDDILEGLQVRSTLLDDEYLWKQARVPFIMDPDFSEKETSIISRAILEFHKVSCVRFVSKTNEEDYIHISRKGGCSSYVGRTGGAQILNLAPECLYSGIIMHELMHILGFVHEHNRLDRDEYVDVFWNNIKDGRKENFLKLEWYNMSALDEKYDYESILHYHRFAFSKSPGKKPTLEPKKKRARIGQRKYLSPGDIRKINKLYECSKF